MSLVCMPRNNEYLYYLLNNRNKNYSILLKKNYSLKKNDSFTICFINSSLMTLWNFTDWPLRQCEGHSPSTSPGQSCPAHWPSIPPCQKQDYTWTPTRSDLQIELLVIDIEQCTGLLLDKTQRSHLMWPVSCYWQKACFYDYIWLLIANILYFTQK